MKATRAYFVALLGIAVFVGTGEASTLYVDCEGGGDYLSIQDAVDAAASGDTIRVAPCEYYESVVVPGKELTIEGSGSDVTELTWGEDYGPTLDFEYDGTPTTQRLIGMSVSGTYSPFHRALVFDQTLLVMEDCDIQGQAHVPSGPYVLEADIDATSCRFTALHMYGWYGTPPSTITDCDVGTLYTFWHGGCAPGIGAHAVVFSSGSTYETVNMGAGGELSCTGDSIGQILVCGDEDWMRVELEVVGGVVGYLLRETSIWSEGEVEASLSNCRIGGFDFAGDSLALNGSIVTGDCTLNNHANLTHNTLLGSAEVSLSGPSEISSNTFVGQLSGSACDSTLIQCNAFVTEPSVSGGTSVDNMVVDPLFCDPAQEDYTLQECSPCVGAAHDGGDIGAFGVGCECEVAVQSATWGAIKAMFRQPPN